MIISSVTRGYSLRSDYLRRTGDRVAVHARLRRERLQHEKRQRALKDVVPALRHRMLGINTYIALYCQAVTEDHPSWGKPGAHS